MEVLENRLRLRRYELGLTLEEVAERAQIDLSNLSRLELGRQGIRPGTARKLAIALDLPMHEFVAELAAAKGA